MPYQLADPIPTIQSLDTVSEGVSTLGVRAMFEATGDGNTPHHTHILACFGVAGWFAHWINLTTHESAMVTGLSGQALCHAYNPYNNRHYVGSNYTGSLAEFNPEDQTITTIKAGGTVDPCRGIIIGDDNKVYYYSYNGSGNPNRVYSYDSDVGMPTGWHDYGALPDTLGDQYGNKDVGSFGCDGTIVYAAAQTDNRTIYTLYTAPVGSTNSWTEWAYQDSTWIYIYKDMDHQRWTAQRAINNSYYWLRPGTPNYELVDSSYAQGDYPYNSPAFCYGAVDEGSYAKFPDYYNYGVDLTFMFPVNIVYEFSRISHWANSTPEDKTISNLPFNGPWFSQILRCALPKSGTTMFFLSEAYNAAIEVDYLAEDYPACTTYKGHELISPYAVKKHPTSGKWYLLGYSDKVLVYDPEADWTLVPGMLATEAGTTPYPAVDTPNPFIIETSVPLLHYRYGIDFDANGLAWIGGNTTRLAANYGNVMWYDPTNGDTGYMFPTWDDAPVTLFRSLCSCLNRTKILVSDDKDNIYRINAADQTVDAVTIAAAGETSESYMIEVAYDRVLVVNQTATETPVYTIGILNPSDMTWEVALDAFNGATGAPFGGINRMYRKFEIGPDGFVWMFIGETLYRVDPTDVNLAFEEVTDQYPASCFSFAPNHTDLIYHNYDTTVKYILGILTYESDYSRGNYSSLPTDDADLDTSYNVDDIADVATDDTDMVAQLATSQIAIHQFKQQINGTGGIINVVAQVTIPCSTSTAYLQIYNRSGTPAWDTIDSDNATGANTDFTLSATVADLTDYKDENNIVACRVYQEMQ